MNSSKVAFNLIKSCVDSALKRQEKINTNNYVVDLSGIAKINKSGQDSFIKFKALLLPTTIEDSTIIYDDPSWSKFHMARSMIIKFDSIQQQTNGKVRVEMRKIKSSENIITLNLALQRSGDGYEFIKY